MNNEYECRYTFDLKPYFEPIYEVFSDGNKVIINVCDPKFHSPIDDMFKNDK